MRVVEVARNDTLQVASVLDFVGQNPHPNSTLIKGNNINGDKRNVSGATRFSVVPPTLITLNGGSAIAGGSGALVNLTTGNLNWIFSWLATEFHSDVLTAPEVVVLNGQTVELISGSKVPFLIGQNVITGQGQNVQQFFYKHVGTYISVTPQIVNWGVHAEGSGKAALQESEIVNWQQFLPALDGLIKAKQISVPNWPDGAAMPDIDDAINKIHLAQMSLDNAKKDVADPKPPPEAAAKLAAAQTAFDKANTYLTVVKSQLEIYNSLYKGLPLSTTARSSLLTLLASYYSRAELQALGLPICCREGCDGCNWHAEDCTIDLNVVARFSDADNTTFTVPITTNPPTKEANITTPVPIESNVRAISNIVQVKSGHGVVMGGVIGEQDVKDVSKVPVLGDIPVVGFLFRSKSTNRQKTELLIFIEAKVLDPCPDAARMQSYENFWLGGPYVAGEFLDNPLELGMYRAGFGTYLPPTCPAERIYWERLGRKIRKVATSIDDTFE
jgi:hypothetical protein